MPRDKTVTQAKLYKCMKKEFLEKGFEKASLNQIARDCDITPAAVYRHFESKEAMFEALVQPAWQEFQELCDFYMVRETTGISKEHITRHFMEDGTQWLGVMLDMIYRYFDEFRLMICCSKGTKFENFEETLIKMEEDSTKDIIKALREAGMSDVDYTDGQIHIMATAYITALFEIVRHNVPRQQAGEQITFLYRFFNCAWKNMLQIKM
jgi:AcrR family transcriptional regulator